MEEYYVNPIKYAVIGLLILAIFLGLIFLPLSSGKAQTGQSNTATPVKPARFSDALAGNTLCSAGLGCDKAQQQTPQAPNILSGLFGGGSSGPQFDPVISVVNVEGQTAVYRIINGNRHSIPTTEIFYSYGFDVSIVQKISQKELDKYSLAKLFTVESTEEEENPVIYYLTEGGMLRPVLNDKVFYSYGDRKEDIITINQKEFNYYPRNQYIFVERPKLNRDIYQITGGVKRYITPVAVKRLNLKESEIAPVNQIEFDEYPEGESIIF